ncbi:MAG TPA: PIN domain-containing protein [Geminicoccaceae bacterium]|nr:PIN domain-containing protein [Geminicoccaceae bacterium]
MDDVFVDTSAFFALANLADTHHTEALAAYEATVGHADLKTSDHVLLETWYLLRSRLGRSAAMAFWDGFDRGPFTIMGVSAQDMRRGREIAREWSDQAFSVVDCTSFALIERLDIRRAFTFDKHFRLVRFGWRRHRALQILPR